MSKSATKRGAALYPMQKAFVREYLKDGNGTQAAIRAGYSEKTAGAQASDLLKVPKVAAAVARGRKRTQDRADLTVDDVVRGFREIAECDVTSVVGWNEHGELVVTNFADVPPAVRRCISEIRQTETKDGARSIAIKFYSKTEALKQLGQHFGMFVQRVEVDASETVRAGLARVHEALAKKREREST